MQEDSFAWGDPKVAGSRLDPQTMDFSWRAAELWTQVVALRELVDRSALEGQVEDGDAQQGDAGGTSSLTEALEQVRGEEKLSRR